MSKGKLPRPLEAHLLGMQEEIEERRKKAEQETGAAYGLLISLLIRNEHHEELYKNDPLYKSEFDLIYTRYSAIMKEV